MKVICIDDKNAVDGSGDIPELKEGAEYEVAQCLFNDGCYAVQGISLQFGGYLNNSYLKSRFIPLSEIDETEMVRESLTEKV